MTPQTPDTHAYRSLDRATLRAAAVELRARGLTARDIADALRLTEGAVRALLSIPSTASESSP